ncbi:MAG: chromosome partitioning protein ParB [Bacteroidetes bacterium HGW-Bacteroidetes-6]|jgi:ParB family chromosome partitioning protein|nr:MAG: chromosome partitioning protein ParB [Bacteroidetes bacterium HGW-Bacteroidetes-6]
MNTKKKALGRGLSALLDGADAETGHGVSTPVIAFPLIDVDEIEANPYQPRDTFEEEALNGLAESIRYQGLIQPVTVRKLEDGKYQLISGERRLRASKLAGLNQIPAFIREADDVAVLQMALVENIQRENLNAMEIAFTFEKLMEECNFTQEEMSEKVGKKRTTIANYLRLLRLPIEIQAGIRDNKISMGHARSLLSIENNEAKQKELYQKILSADLSVRQVEEIVRTINNPPNKKAKKTIALASEFDSLKKNLTQKTGLKISLKATARGGSLTLHFKNEDELHKIEKLFQ